MYYMKAEIRKMGNSYGILLPKRVVAEYTLQKGEEVEFLIVKKQPLNGFGLLKGKKLKPFKREEFLGRGF